ncbi:pra1 family protein [Plakobranchus ocellatus]|uniref:PRA1 family protein n=1 Tax=Plakobranchus ocellatus TaxID=259542 RepID=A0AAV3YQB9_9GAST|nr:pra1 family protein [Plakobranchus ocellatus]
MADVELAPLRSMGDFLLDSARFQIPQINDPEKWSNRVLNNLLYYQSNYFLAALLIFLLIGIIHPVQILFGFTALAICFGLFVYCTNNQYKARRFKHDHPVFCVAAIIAAGYFVVYMFGAVLVFLFGIAFPLLLILIHASLRLRNLKNKFANKLEYVGLKRTPMGLILEGLGQEQEAGS